MADQKPPQSSLNSTFGPVIRAGLKRSIFSSASSPAIANMTRQFKEEGDLEEKRPGDSGSSFLTVPEVPAQILQNSSSSSAISSWFRAPFERTFQQTADIEQYAPENIPHESHLGDEVNFGVTLPKSDLNQFPIHADADKTKKTEMLSKLDDKFSKKGQNQATQPQMRFNVANFDLNAVGPSSW